MNKIITTLITIISVFSLAIPVVSYAGQVGDSGQPGDSGQVGYGAMVPTGNTIIDEKAYNECVLNSIDDLYKNVKKDLINDQFKTTIEGKVKATLKNLITKSSDSISSIAGYQIDSAVSSALGKVFDDRKYNEKIMQNAKKLMHGCIDSAVASSGQVSGQQVNGSGQVGGYQVQGSGNGQCYAARAW